MQIEQPCVIEQVVLSISPGANEDFEAALVRGFEFICQAEGFRWVHALHRIEDPETYVLLLGWNSMEDHTERFVGSALFDHWRAEVGAYLVSPPDVNHHRVRVSRG